LICYIACKYNVNYKYSDTNDETIGKDEIVLSTVDSDSAINGDYMEPLVESAVVDTENEGKGNKKGKRMKV